MTKETRTAWLSDYQVSSLTSNTTKDITEYREDSARAGARADCHVIDHGMVGRGQRRVTMYA